MVAIFTGAGTGFERGSGNVLGGAGLLPSIMTRRGGEQVMLNAANGNLMISRQDEYLVGRGPDAAVSRTYNSLGDMTDDNGDNWRQSTQRQVRDLSGNLNSWGSTVKRVSGDGSIITYGWDGAGYVATDGAGAHDRITFEGGAWRWKDGDTGTVEVYGGPANWISQMIDTDGHSISYAYAGNHLIDVRTSSGENIHYTWSGDNLAEVATITREGGVLKQSTRTRYDYDGYNRLTKVTVDLTPEDNGTWDGNVYTTSYTYHGASKLIASIADRDGFGVDIGYDGNNRVASTTQYVSNGTPRTTTVAYGAGFTAVTDPQGQTTRLEYGTGALEGQLLTVTLPPAQPGAAAQTVQFGYDADANMTSMSDATGVARFQYDARGNLVWSEDRLGNIATRIYDAANHILAETTTGSDAIGTAAAHTVRYAYDAGGRLRFAVDAEGGVTEYTYNGAYEVNGIARFAGARYDMTGWSPMQTLELAALDAWRAQVDKSFAHVTTIARGDRGEVLQETTYAASGIQGMPLEHEGYHGRRSSYDPSGRLLSRYTSNENAEVFVYDGMGRVIASTDTAGATTRIAFHDGSRQTVVTLASGLVTTSSYNSAGELIAVVEGGAHLSGGTANFSYDNLGRLRSSVDATGRRTSYIYDTIGRKSADISDGGGMVEYRYDAADRLVATVRYANTMAGWQWNAASDPNQSPSAASVRPAASAQDIWAWTIYDADDRVVQTIGGDGGTTTYEYDGADQLVRTTAYAAKIEGWRIDGFKSAAPTGVQLPAAGAGDSVERRFYDRAGRLIGTLDGEGRLSRIGLDAIGTKVQEVHYGNLVPDHLRVKGSFLQLVESVGAHANDATTRWVYDNQGHLRFEIDALNRVTEYGYQTGNLVYTATGQPRQVTRYAVSIAPLGSYTYDTVRQAVANAGLAGNPSNRVSQSVYDAAGRLVYGIDAEGAVTGYRYDTMGNIVRTIAYADRRTVGGLPDAPTMDGWHAAVAGNAANRITRAYYNGRGELRFAVDAEGYVTRKDYDAEGRQTYLVTWSNALAVTDAWTIDTVAGNVSGDTAATTYAYNANGRVSRTIDAVGTATDYHYAGNGTLVVEIVAPHTADERHVRHVYDASGRETTRYDAAGSIDQSATHYAYDGRGNLVSTTDGAGRVTTRTYDRAGQVASVTDAMGGVTSYGYDSLGNRVRETDARGSVTWNYYDRTGRLVAVRDAENYVTETSYTAFGDIAMVTRRAVRSYTGAGPEWPAVSANTQDATTQFFYDKLGRAILIRDAEGYVEQRWYDVSGNVVQEQNKVGGITRRVFDRRGQVIAETAPMGSIDSAGNVLEREAAVDRFDPTYYRAVHGDLAHMDDAALLNHWQTYGWRERRNPNAFFNTGFYLDAHPDIAAAGVNPLHHYANWGLREGRRPAAGPATADPALTGGVVTRFEYGSRGNLTRRIEASGLPEQRTTRFAYDRADRLIETRGDAVHWVDQAANGVQGMSEPVERRSYDGRGNLVETVDPRGARTLFYYDKLDRQTDRVDALGNMVSWRYDAVGNVTHERRWAIASPGSGIGNLQFPAITGSDRVTDYSFDGLNRMTSSTLRGVRTGAWDGNRYITGINDVTTRYDYDATGNVLRSVDGAGNAVHTTYDRLGRRARQVDAEGYQTTWVSDAHGNIEHERRWASRSPGYGVGWIADPAASGDDRITEFTYDHMGRRLAETRRNVAAYWVDGAGGLQAAFTDATVTYQYNGLGQVTRRSEATGDTTFYEYDRSGRLSHETKAGYHDHDGVWTLPLLTYRYDGLGNITRTEQTRQFGGDVRIVRYGYAAGGRLHTMTDAAGTVFTYWQDIAGAEVIQTWNRNRADGSVTHEGALYIRDVLGRVTGQSTGWWNGQWNRGDIQQTRYNVFGEMSQRGINGLQESFDYDNAGQLARTNSDDGVWRYFVSDAAGRRTLTLENQGRGDLVGTSVDMMLHVITAGSAHPGELIVDGVALTLAILDRRGQQVATRLPDRELTQGSRYILGLAADYTAFGELAWERDAAGATTSYAYNTMGRRTTVTRAAVEVTDEAGNTSWINPTERFFYDAGGRLIAQDDANGRRTTRHLLAGTGYGTTPALVTAEFHADRGVARSGYDRFGDKRTATDELNRITQLSYDALGRLTQEIRPSGNSDSFAYDVLGQRIRHWNNMLGYDDAEVTTYDHQARIVATRAFGGDTVTTAYIWSGDLTTAGMGTYGGWHQETIHANGYRTVEQSDVFGHVVYSHDHLANVSQYSTDIAYDLGGRMVRRSGNGETVEYRWYNTGLLAEQWSDLGRGTVLAVSRYGYDAAGRKTRERFERESVTLTDSVASYDAVGRMTYWEQGHAALPYASTRWSYDAVGNIRRTQTDRPGLDQWGNAVGRGYEDHWFAYDAMNRVVLDGGQLLNGQIVRGWSGTSLTYDAAGQRATSTRNAALTGQVRVLEDDRDDRYPPRHLEGDSTEAVHRVIQQRRYDGERQERFGYSVDGLLMTVGIEETGYYDDGNGNLVVTGVLDRPGGSAEFAYDRMGRQTGQVDRRADRYAVYDHQQKLSPGGRVMSSITRRLENGTMLTVDTTNRYSANGMEALGQVVSSTTISTRGNENSVTTEVENFYQFRGGGAQIASSQTSGQTSSYTSYLYGAGGRLETIAINDGRPRTVSIVSDLSGQVLKRDESSASTANPHERWYRFNGNELGHVGNDGTWARDYADTIRTRGEAPLPGPFGNNRSYGYQFAKSIDTITSYEQGSSGGGYTVRAGDTLAGIAAQVWGDASLWYKLASANGLSADSALTAGQTLTLPAGVVRSTYNASQLRPYDPADAIGDVSPVSTTPAAQGRKSNKCGTFGKILLVAVAVAVTALTAGAAAAVIAPGATAAAGGGILGGLTALGSGAVGVGAAVGIGIGAGIAGSVVSQGVGLATGIQDKFNWKGVALAGIAGGVGGGLAASGILSGGTGLTGVLNAAARGAVSNIATQGIALATGLQGKFDWVGVAVGAAVGGGAKAGTISGLGPVGGSLVSGMAGALAGGAARSLINGSSFGDNVLAALPDVIGTTVGNMFVRAVAEDGRKGSGSMSTAENELVGKARESSEAITPVEANRMWAANGGGGRTVPSAQAMGNGPRASGLTIVGSASGDARIEVASDGDLVITAPRIYSFNADHALESFYGFRRYSGELPFSLNFDRDLSLGLASAPYKVAARTRIGGAVFRNPDPSDASRVASARYLEAVSTPGLGGLLYGMANVLGVSDQRSGALSTLGTAIDGLGIGRMLTPRPSFNILRSGGSVNAAERTGVDLALTYKPGWSVAQRAEADLKVQRLTEGNTVVSQSTRSGTSAASRYRSAGNQISPGNDIDHAIDLQLGGSDTVSNMWPLNSSVNRSLGSQIQQRIKNLPPGTVVNKVTIRDR